MARWIILLFLTYVESQILLIQRSYLGDALTCESNVRCADIRAAQINKTSCLCPNKGTILSSSNYWCSTDAGQRAGKILICRLVKIEAKKIFLLTFFIRLLFFSSSFKLNHPNYFG